MLFFRFCFPSSSSSLPLLPLAPPSSSPSDPDALPSSPSSSLSLSESVTSTTSTPGQSTKPAGLSSAAAACNGRPGASGGLQLVAINCGLSAARLGAPRPLLHGGGGLSMPSRCRPAMGCGHGQAPRHTAQHTALLEQYCAPVAAFVTSKQAHPATAPLPYSKASWPPTCSSSVHRQASSAAASSSFCGTAGRGSFSKAQGQHTHIASCPTACMGAPAAAGRAGTVASGGCRAGLWISGSLVSRSTASLPAGQCR